MTPPPASFATDLQALAHGDQAAWRRIYERSAVVLRQLARGFLPADQVDDAVQDIFLHLRRAADQFQPQPGPQQEQQARAWVYTVAKRRLLNRLRDERRQAFQELHEQDLAAGHDPAQQLFDQELQGALAAALKGLSEADQQLLRERYGKRVPLSELATLYGCEAGALRVRLHRALGRLRQRLPPGSRIGLLLLLIVLGSTSELTAEVDDAPAPASRRAIQRRRPPRKPQPAPARVPIRARYWLGFLLLAIAIPAWWLGIADRSLQAPTSLAAVEQETVAESPLPIGSTTTEMEAFQNPFGPQYQTAHLIKARAETSSTETWSAGQLVWIGTPDRSQGSLAFVMLAAPGESDCLLLVPEFDLAAAELLLGQPIYAVLPPPSLSDSDATLGTLLDQEPLSLSNISSDIVLGFMQADPRREPAVRWGWAAFDQGLVLVCQAGVARDREAIGPLPVFLIRQGASTNVSTARNGIVRRLDNWAPTAPAD